MTKVKVNKEVANKFDGDKPMIDLVPPEAIVAIAEALTMGAKKYGKHNWLNGMEWSRVYAAAQRHLLSWQQGIDTDEESGMNHLNHALTNIAFLLTYQSRGIGEDDRIKLIKKEK